MESKILVENKLLLLTPLDESMYFDIWQNSLDEDNRKYVPDEVFETLEDATEAVNYLINYYGDDNGPYVYAVIRKQDKANLGYVQLVKIDEGFEIGYHIAKRYTNKGYATEALKLFLEYLKTTTNLKEVYGIALMDNKASRRVLEKCGFIVFYKGKGIYQGRLKKIIKSKIELK